MAELLRALLDREARLLDRLLREEDERKAGAPENSSSPEAKIADPSQGDDP